MTNLYNTLYVTTPGAYLRKDHDNILVRIERKTALSVPIHHLASIVCFGQVSVSPGVMYACGKAGVGLSFISTTGRFLARMVGPGSGCVALRRAQFRLSDDEVAKARFGRSFIAGKIANARAFLMRGARESDDAEAKGALDGAIDALRRTIESIESQEDRTLDWYRGHEGDAARAYFRAFDRLLRRDREAFRFDGRTRRPPLDPMNALLSFLYSLVAQDAAAAVQSVGLDPAVGFLHADRPGRPALALDLAEEFRAAVADRLAVALINLGQIRRPDS